MPNEMRRSRHVGQHYESLMQSPLSKEVLRGLASCRWSGRNEIIDTDKAIYYIDGAQ
jgi:folylpolyglutamate synthase/dihydropteroate synthase